MTAAGQYPMKAVARLTGLTPDTIRAWERRYGAITPTRTDSSHRLYSQQDVERLRLLRLATEAGHGIGRVARLPEADLRALLAPAFAVRPGSSGAAGAGLDEGVARLLDAIARYDQRAAELELSRLAALASPRQVVLEVAWPLLGEIGERWYDGRLSVAHEHLATSLVRSLLGTLLRLAEPRVAYPPVVLATLSGERHELGALMAGLLVAARGVPVCYLGPDAPADAIAATARALGAAAVGVSLVYVPDPAATGAALRDLAAALPPGTALWIGGSGAERLPCDAPPCDAPPCDAPPGGAHLLLTVAALDAALDDLIARSARPG